MLSSTDGGSDTTSRDRPRDSVDDDLYENAAEILAQDQSKRERGIACEKYPELVEQGRAARDAGLPADTPDEIIADCAETKSIRSHTNGS